MSHAALVAIVLAVSCGGPTKPPEPIGNTGDPPPVDPGPSMVKGVITDDVGQPVVGATVVLVDPGGTLLVGEQVTLTNEQGAYSFENTPDGKYELTLYYSDLSYRRRFSIDGPTTLNQAIRITGYGSGEMIVCADDRATSCR